MSLVRIFGSANSCGLHVCICDGIVRRGRTNRLGRLCDSVRNISVFRADSFVGDVIDFGGLRGERLSSQVACLLILGFWDIDYLGRVQCCGLRHNSGLGAQRSGASGVDVFVIPIAGSSDGCSGCDDSNED